MRLDVPIERPAISRSDEDLAKRAAGGDEESFRQLFDRHARRIYSAAYHIVGNRQDAEDVMQEVFLALHRDLGCFRAESRFATWLYRIVLGRAINYRKSRGAYQARVDRFKESSRLPHSPSGDDRVREALDALPEDYRALAVLRYFSGLSYEELAEVGGWPLGTVKSKMNRVHEALRGLLMNGEAKA